MKEFENQLDCLKEQGVIAKYQKDKFLEVYEKASTNKRLWYDKNLMILINTKQKITEIKHLKSIKNNVQFFFWLSLVTGVLWMLLYLYFSN